MPSPFLRRLLATIVAFAASSACGFANLEPRTITLAPGPRTVAEVLDEIEKQTGNRVVDRRSAGAPAKVDIGFEKLTFWKALDRLTRELGAQVALYHDDGIRLVDGAARRSPAESTVCNAGVCRVDLKSLALQREVDGDRRSCVLQMEVAWEPRYEPIYLAVEEVHGTFAADANKKESKFGPIGGIAQIVTQRRAQIVELRLTPPPDRSSPAIASLQGKLKFLGPTQMVNATFANLAASKNSRVYVEPNAIDPATVTLKSVAANDDNWVFDVEIANPKKNPKFESFQQATWFENNRIHLERVKNGVKEIWTPPVNEREEDVRHDGAKATYRFTDVRGKGPLADWTLVYRTPGLIEETTVPFEFRNVALP